MKDTAKIVQFDTLIQRERNTKFASCSLVSIDLDKLYGKLELEVAREMIVSDLRIQLDEMLTKMDQLDQIQTRLEEL